MTSDRNNDEVKKRVEFVKENVGKETLDILEKAGMGVDTSLAKILSKGIEKEKILESIRNNWAPGVVEKNCMASELVYLMDSNNPNDMFTKELYRRLDLLELSDKQKQDFIQSDYSILQRRPKLLKFERWVARNYIMQGIRKEDLLKPEECALSELIAMFDDADSARVRDHHWLAEKTMEAVWDVLRGLENKRSPYYAEYDKRLENWGWTEDQSNSYVKNECMLLARLKWGYHKDPEWVEKTMVKS